MKSPALLRTISWKTLLACIAGVLLASTIAHAEFPVPVPETTPAALARIRDGNIQGAAFRLLDLAIPLLILFTGLGARLRRMCESISGHRWFSTVTLFACAYLVLAGLIALPFDFSAGYAWTHAAGWSHQALPDWLKGEGVQIAAKLVVAALLIWLPYKLIARSPRRWWLYGALALCDEYPRLSRRQQHGRGRPRPDASHLSPDQPGVGRVTRPNRIHHRPRIEALRHGGQLDGPGVHRWLPVGRTLAHRPSGPRRHPPVLAALG